VAEAAVAGLTGDAVHGRAHLLGGRLRLVPHGRGCAKDADQLVLSGGQRFASPFGTFVAPNISQDPQEGIGGWTLADLASALTRGVSKAGEHLYYPALPYASYARMEMQDVADLYAFLKTLPADPTPSQPHELGFPFSIRDLARGLEVDVPVGRLGGAGEPDADRHARPLHRRGAGALRRMPHAAQHSGRAGPFALAGRRGPEPLGQGRIPNITPAKLTWTAADIVQYLTTGFTPDYDSVGGHMAHVVENMARLPESDRLAVAEYLLAVPNVQ
jgi:hypothetical protein